MKFVGLKLPGPAPAEVPVPGADETPVDMPEGTSERETATKKKPAAKAK